MAKLGIVAKDLAARKLLEQSEQYSVAKIDGCLAGFYDRTGQVKWQIEDGRGRIAYLLSKFSRYFTPEEIIILREHDAKLAGFWDALHAAYNAAQKLKAGLVERREKERATE